MPKTIHVIVRFHEKGVYATSPQVPGLAMGRDSFEDVEAEIVEAIRFSSDDPIEYHQAIIQWHFEEMHTIGDHEVVIRGAQDSRWADRDMLRRRLLGSLSDETQATFLDFDTNPLGEIVYVLAIGTDSLAWVNNQMRPSGDNVVLVVGLDERRIRGIGVGRTPDETVDDFEGLGLPARPEVRDLMMASRSQRVERRELTV